MTGIQETMYELKEGSLRSSSGQKVKKRSQALAIGLSEERRAGRNSRTMRGLGDALAAYRRR